MQEKAARELVEKFYIDNAGTSAQDSFPVWYLHHVLELPIETAFKNSSDPKDHKGGNNYDFGIDAFHLNLMDTKPRLTLIQAKYSSSLSLINQGFKGFERSIYVIANMLENRECEDHKQNKVLSNLHAELNKLDDIVKRQLVIEFLVIHLSTEDEEIIAHKTVKTRDDLTDEAKNTLSDYSFRIRQEGPGKWKHETTVIPSEWTPLSIFGNMSSIDDQDNSTCMSLGIGYLSELVELYDQRRDYLFAKNVRYYIKSKKNTETGPAAKMKETLKEICIQSSPQVKPDTFAFYHNGVTIYSKEVRPGGTGIEVKNPYVLNGCQTIKNAYFFRTDPKLRAKINPAAWQEIKIPIRIVSTKNDRLVNLITINNNRQNAISYDALRANDPVQIDLESRFTKAKIIYERQQGAFATLIDTHPEMLDEVYTNTYGTRVNIVELARTICAAAGELSLSLSPSHIFESDSAYERVFSNKRLRSISLLAFLQNLHDVIPVILKKDYGLKGAGNGWSATRLTYHTIALLINYFESNEDMKVIKKYGGQLWGRNKEFRADISKLLDNYHSKILRVLKEKFLVLESPKNELLREIYKEAAQDYKSKWDIFTLACDIDSEVFKDQEL